MKKYLHTHVHSSILLIKPKSQTALVFINRWICKQYVVCADHNALLRGRKSWHMLWHGWTWSPYVKWNKPIYKSSKLHGSSALKLLDFIQVESRITAHSHPALVLNWDASIIKISQGRDHFTLNLKNSELGTSTVALHRKPLLWHLMWVPVPVVPLSV